MAGALLGLLGGGAIGYAGAKHREQLEQKHEADEYGRQIFLNGFDPSRGGDPTKINNPDIQKQGKRLFGDSWGMIVPTLQAQGATYARLAKNPELAWNPSAAPGLPPMGGGPPGGPGDAPMQAAPAAAPTPTMRKPPALLPQTTINGQGGAPMPSDPTSAGAAPEIQPASATGAAPQAASAAAPAAAPAQSPFAEIDQHISNTEQMMAKAPPYMQERLKQHLDDLRLWRKNAETERKDTETQAEKAAVDERYERFHKDTMSVLGARLGLEAKGQADTAEYRNLSLRLSTNLKEMAQQSNDLQHQFMNRMKESEDKAHAQAHFDAASTQLGKDLESYHKLLTASNPIDKASTQGLLNQWNARARALKRQADKQGLDYDPDMFKPQNAQTLEKTGLSGVWGKLMGKSATTTIVPEPSTPGTPATPGGDAASLIGKY